METRRAFLKSSAATGLVLAFPACAAAPATARPTRRRATARTLRLERPTGTCRRRERRWCSTADLRRNSRRRSPTPKQNGGKTLEQLLDHVSHDALVLWGWSPGGERAPVPTPHAEFVAAFKAWIDAGAPSGQ
ncbi:MAG TPA: hypothetical protein VFD82_07155 [Planctomycetota bacterium]|nr:hypothetical protein [Planctomycetota bacterium]